MAWFSIVYVRYGMVRDDIAECGMTPVLRRDVSLGVVFSTISSVFEKVVLHRV